MSGVAVISDAHWGNARDIVIGDLSVGWRVNGPGRASIRLPAETSHLLGWADLKGRWLWIPLGWLPYWGGEIEDDPGDLGSGTVELSAGSFAEQLYHRITPRTYRQANGSAGSLIGRYIKDAAFENPLWLDSVSIDEDGMAISREARGENLGQAIQSLATGQDGAWDVAVDEDRQIAFTYRAEPADMRASIALIEGYNVLAGSIRPSVSRIVNDLLAVANDFAWQEAGGARVIDADSVRTYGRRQASKRYPGHTRKSSLAGVARAEVTRLALPEATVSVEIAATDPVLQTLRTWQVVRLWSGTVNATYDFTTTGMAYESIRRTVTVVGTAVPS